MKHLAPLLTALLLASCGFTAPPRDTAQFSTRSLGLDVTWRFVRPGELDTPGYMIRGSAHITPLGRSCVIDLDPVQAEDQLTAVAAHELGHCFAAKLLIPGVPRPDLGAHYATPIEGYAQSYAVAYLDECGLSRAPMGWEDRRTAKCRELPDPWLVYRRVTSD